LNNLKILVIDDDEDDYFITSQHLEEIETALVTCKWCYNITEAREQLKSNAYDFYFLDYRLGAKTGLELLEEAIQNGCNKPIILLTGKGTLEIDRKAVESGAYDYLIKSELTTEKLERCLRYSLERYKSFKVINDNEKKYRLIFNNAISFIFTCNKFFEFIDCNPAAEYFVGYLPRELKNMNLLSIISSSDVAVVKNNLMFKKNIKNLQVKFVHQSKEIRAGNLSISYFEDETQGAYWQGIIYDETLRLQAEQEKLQTEKLEATYRLVRTLAHEIRNPLTNIGLSLEGIVDKGIQPEQMPYVDIIKRGSKRINDIISELLQSSKKIDLNPELVNLNTLIEEVIAFARDRIALKNIRPKVTLLEQPVYKKLDKEKFKIAVLNLVVNAIEAMDKDEKELTIALQQSLDYTSLTIKDNGCGISEEGLKKLYEPYFTTKKNGMGLGLVSTLNIIKSHNAQIEVDSEINVGTSFKIIFLN
jgi:PAS domain S-box-containing protein